MRQTSRTRRRFVALVFSLAASFLAQPVVGQSGPLSPFGFRLASGVNWDSNVFRLPDSAPDPRAAAGVSGKSDRFTTTTFGVLFDKSYAQQQFVANVNQTAIRYDKFSSNNRDAFDYRVAWQWHLTPRISGTLSVDHNESAVGFEDVTLGTRLIQTSIDNRRFAVDGWLFGGWHLLAGVSQSDMKNSQAFVAVPSVKQTTDEIGLRYIAESRSLIGALWRSSRGIYPGQEGNLSSLIDTGFTVREMELNATWVTSGKSTLNGRLTRVERRYDRFTQLNFSGVNGELSYLWTPTGRITINASALRTLAPFFQVASGVSSGSAYRMDNVLAFAPSWQVSEKVNLNMNASRRVTDYLGGAVPAGGSSRNDTSRRLSLGASWAAHSKVNVTATLVREERSSNVPGLDYADTVLGATAVLSY